MSQIPSVIFISSGMFLSKIIKPKKAFISGVVIASTCLYSGTMYEYDKLVRMQPIKIKSVGCSLINIGLVGIGLALGSIDGNCL